MKNPYIFGFYCALSVVLVLLVAIFWGRLEEGGSDKAFAFIASLSSLVQAVAAVVVGGIAFHGLSAWRNQIIYGKALGVIWDAQVALRQIESFGSEYLNRRDIRGRGNRTREQVAEEIGGVELGRAFTQFKHQCILLDKVVVKQKADWQEHADNLEKAFQNLAIEIGKPPPDPARGLFGAVGKRSDKKVEEYLSEADEWIDRMSLLLAGLEERYSV